MMYCAGGRGGKDRLFLRLRHLLSSRPLTPAQIRMVWAGCDVCHRVSPQPGGPAQRRLLASPEGDGKSAGRKRRRRMVCRLPGGGHARPREPRGQRRAQRPCWTARLLFRQHSPRGGAGEGAWAGLRRSPENHARKSASDHVSGTELRLMVGKGKPNKL